ncbi:MAG TPA: HlyD family secretion protein [Thermoanaerobaculia bacterium]|jgi:membrane fusion protein (multidrug efflux system)|nr:HlyD family secretion protein [Thermoanaerobaculia bacterium]
MSSPLRVEKREPAAPPTPAEPKAPPRAGGGFRKVIILTVLALLALAGAVFGIRTYLFYQHNATTEDAQIDGNIDPVLPRVSGYVQEVRVSDNQHVNAGDVLVVIDPSDLQAKVDQEQAAVLNAQAAVSVAQAAVSSARATAASARARISGSQADVTAARTRQEQTAADLARYKALFSKEEVSRQQYEAARAAADAARAAAQAAGATTESSRATADAAAAQVQAAEQQVAAARAQVAQHQATLEAARLQLSYATIKAPVSGTVSKKSVEVGQLVQAGQPLLAIVQGHGAWVTANFKETQLARMRPGQPVEIEVDAYPGVTFHGKVQSLAAATGAKFSLLPPDNATGNFTKVVQRVPVKIAFTDPPDPRHPLRVGMNTTVIVKLD